MFGVVENPCHTHATPMQSVGHLKIPSIVEFEDIRTDCDTLLLQMLVARFVV